MSVKSLAEMWVFLKSSASKTGNFFTKLAIIGNTPLSLAVRLEARCGPCNLRCHSKDVIKGSFVAVVNTGSLENKGESAEIGFSARVCART